MLSVVVNGKKEVTLFSNYAMRTLTALTPFAPFCNS
jgi:hypothetical protein